MIRWPTKWVQNPVLSRVISSKSTYTYRGYDASYLFIVSFIGVSSLNLWLVGSPLCGVQCQKHENPAAPNTTNSWCNSSPKPDSEWLCNHTSMQAPKQAWLLANIGLQQGTQSLKHPGSLPAQAFEWRVWADACNMRLCHYSQLQKHRYWRLFWKTCLWTCWPHVYLAPIACIKQAVWLCRPKGETDRNNICQKMKDFLG